MRKRGSGMGRRNVAGASPETDAPCEAYEGGTRGGGGGAEPAPRIVHGFFCRREAFCEEWGADRDGGACGYPVWCGQGS